MLVDCESGVFETAAYYGGIKVTIPYVRINGAEDGPQVTVMAAQHGRELNGIEVIRRVIDRLRKDASLSGTCVLIPVANPPAVRIRQQDFPSEVGRDSRVGHCYNLNRVWPGRTDGTLQEAMAHSLWNGAIRDSQLCIDLHGWTSRSTSLLYGCQSNAELVCAAGFDIHMLGADPLESDIDGHMRNTCFHAGIPSITIELASQNILNEEAISMGTRAVLNLLRKLGVLEGPPELPIRQFEFTDRQQEFVVKAPRGGLFVPRLGVLSEVDTGDVLAEIVNLEDVLDVTPVVAPAPSVIFHMSSPLCAPDHSKSAIVEEGDTVALLREVARVIRHQPVQSAQTG